jgi:hypothetical protein
MPIAYLDVPRGLERTMLKQIEAAVTEARRTP